MLQSISPLAMLGNPDAARAMVAAFLCDPDMQAGILNRAVEFIESTKITEIQCWGDTEAITAEPATVAGAYAISAVASPASFVQMLAAHACAEFGIPFAVEFSDDSGQFEPELGAL